MEGLLRRAPAVDGEAGHVERSNLRAAARMAIAMVCLLSSAYFALVIAPQGLGANAPTVQQGLFPEWYGSRELLFKGHDPYSPETTRHIRTAVYASASGGDAHLRNQHRFAYPVFFVFLFLPLAILPFSFAQWFALAACIAGTALSVRLWLRSGRGLSHWSWVGLIFASYPVMLGLQLRQPTLLVAALLAAVVYCARSERLGLAGVLAALSTCKPQLAIAVLLPLSIWCVAEWRVRRRFALAAGIVLAALLLASEWISPGWFSRWIWTLKAYSHYAGTRPLLADLLGGRLVMEAAAVLVGAAAWVSYRYRDEDLLLAISFSIAVFQLLFPFQIYNQVLLLPAAVWLARNAAAIQSRGQLLTLSYSCTWIVLGAGWASALGLSLANLITPGAGLTLWQLPLLTAWLYPLPVLATLALYAFPLRCPHLQTGRAALQAP